MTERRGRQADMAHGEGFLLVYLHGVLAGKLIRTPERLVFEYEQEYLERADAEALSRRLPLERGPSKPGEAIKWFDGLLPEGERRDWIARQANTPSMSTYSMLEAIGAECAGAVEVKAPGRELEPRKEPAGREEIEQYVEEIRKSPLGTPERPLTLSLAGAQAKFVLVEEADGSWSWPVGGYPSTHILKPEQERFPGLVENEHACMELARRAGLPAARTRIEEFGAYKALVVARFDRDAKGGRVHQEDFCQALGVRQKYQRDRGPALQDCFERSGVGGWDLWDQAMYAWLIGDEDKHAKNFSVQYPREGPARLAPIYDAVCTLAYPELDRGMAMRIGRAWQVREVDGKAIGNQAGRCGLEGDEAARRLYGLAGKVRAALRALEEEGVDVRQLKRAGIEARLDQAREFSEGKKAREGG